MNFEPIKLDVLVIAPHPDDAELGAGGAILKMLAAGTSVGVLDLTDGEPTPHGSIEIRNRETAAATRTLGLPWRASLGLPNRKLVADLDSRKKLAEVFRAVAPTWLFAPYWIDAHPDHVAATQLVEEARFWSKLTKSDMAGTPHHPQRIYNYYSVHLKSHATPAFVLDISEVWDRKLDAIKCYESQFITGREHLRPSFIEQLEIEASFWGKSIGVKYGEPFHCKEPIGLTEMNSLI